MIEYRVLKELESNPSHTQRTLAGALHISLGKANYVLSGLMHKGIVKARRLRHEPDKIRWQYILTPAGMSEKVRMAADFLQRRMAEFDVLQREIEDLKREVAAAQATALSDGTAGAAAALSESVSAR